MKKIASKIIILYNLNKNILMKNNKKFYFIVLYKNEMEIYYFIFVNNFFLSFFLIINLI